MLTKPKEAIRNTDYLNNTQTNEYSHKEISEQVERNLNKERSSNLEILRIISMLMIVMHHYALYSGFVWENGVTVNRIIVNFFQMFGKLGAITFIIISGYFYDKTKFKLKKFIMLLIQVWTFSIIGLGIGIIINSDKINLVNIIKSIFPTSFSLYWFATCYILMYIFIPFLRKIIENISKRDFKILLTIMVGIWFIYGNIPGIETYSNNLILFITIYLIGGYIKKYNVNFLNNKKRIASVIIIITIMNLIMIIMELLSTKITLLSGKISFFNGQSSPFILILAILLLVIFKNIDIKNTETINKIASTTFGIYLVHENLFLRDIIWKQIVRGSEFTNSPLLIINAILGVIGVFIISMIIYVIIEKLIINNLVKILSKIYYKVKETNLYIQAENKLVNYYNN